MKWWTTGVVGMGITLVGGAALADHPEIVSERGHKYIVWLRPDPNVPLLAENVSYYCGVAQGFARRMWKVTNGRHYVWQVEYFYNSTQPVGHYEVEWTRVDGVATGGSVIAMNDAVVQAAHTFSEGTEPDGITTTQNTRKECIGGLCVTATCPETFTLVEDPNAISPNRERCINPDGNAPLERPEDSAFVFAHEAGHSKYDLPDEYFLNQSSHFYGFRVCSNPEWHTSLMGSREADLWCDANTHLVQRFINTPFAGTTFVPNPTTTDMWTIAKTQWMNLMSYDAGPAFAQGPGVVPQNEIFVNPVAEWQPLPDQPVCLFTGDQFPNQVVNDVMVVVDKSGSMNYRSTALDLTAFQHAFGAGLAHFNRTPAARKAGLSVFDNVNQRAIPYDTFTGARSFNDFNFVADGLTNLCEAISDAALQIRTSGTSDATGHMLLLTDGRPTVPGCNTGAQVRDAAMRACTPPAGEKSVSISVLAFGDADFALLDQISAMCGGDLRTVDPAPAPPAPPPPGPNSVPPGSPTPLAIQAGASRLAYRVRGYTEAMVAVERKPANFERSFDIPPGTSSAEFVWTAERTQNFIIPEVTFTGDSSDVAAAPSGTCAFADYGFEIVDPNGNPAGTDVVSPAVETAYMTRTQRVANPTPGRWTMRATGGEPCVVGGSRPAPEMAMFALYLNNDVRPVVELSKNVAAANEPVTLTAGMTIQQNVFQTNISVTAKLVHGTTQIAVPMFDDGTSGDKFAGDGLYTATINPSCASGSLAAGGYRVVVELTSNASAATPVFSSDSDVQAAMGRNAVPRAPAVTASLVEEKTLAIRPCNSATACGGTTTNLCAQQQSTVNGGPITIRPGTTVPNVSVTVRNCPIGTTGVTVGVGPGITTSNVRSSYDDATGVGTVTFDMTAAANARSGANQIGIAMGQVICGTTGATITTCNPVPTTLPAATIGVCGTGAAQNVTVSRPALGGTCASTQSPTITGRVVTSNGATLNPPRALPSNGVISLIPGTHVVEWTVVAGGTTVTTRQTIFVVSGTSAGGSFILADRARVMSSATAFNSVVNTGTGLTEVGVEARTGDITSRANVFLRDRSTVTGFLRTSGTLTRQNLTTVTGAIQTNLPLSLGGIANPPVTFPTMLPASDIVLAPDAVGSAPPGAHRKLTAFSRSRLTLSAGDYLVEDLDIEPQATVVVSPLTRLFVKNTAIYRGLFVNTAGQPAPTFLAYYGTNALFLESNFSGTLLASSARAVLGDADSRTYAGRVLAKELELRPDVTLTCSGGGGVLFDPTGTAPGTLLLNASATLFEEPPSAGSSRAEEESTGCSVGSPSAGDSRWLAVLGMLALTAALRRKRHSRRKFTA
jgi:MYXO-CTERM domain-containing protein